MKVSMFKKICVGVMLSVAFGLDVPVKNQDFEKHELVQGNDDKHVVHAIECAVRGLKKDESTKEPGKKKQIETFDEEEVK
jgi:hypothetical protein